MSAFERRHPQGKGPSVTRRALSGKKGSVPAGGESAERLLDGLAHNLRNLIQVVNGNLELVASRTEDELALRYLTNAKLAAQLIAELAEGLDEGLPE